MLNVDSTIKRQFLQSENVYFLSMDGIIDKYLSLWMVTYRDLPEPLNILYINIFTKRDFGVRVHDRQGVKKLLKQAKASNSLRNPI